MPEYCVNNEHCGTQGPGWLNGSHPSAREGAVTRKVCFHWRISAVYLRLISQYAIVESPSCTNLLQCIFVTRVTVVTDWRQQQVRHSLQLRCTLKRVKLESNKPCVHVMRKSVKLSSRNIYLFWRQHEKMCEYVITHNQLFAQTDFLIFCHGRRELLMMYASFHRNIRKANQWNNNK